MSFDVNAFLNTPWTWRTKDIPVPELTSFFGDGQPVWRVRNLTTQELHRAESAASTRMREAALAKALSGTRAKDITRAARELLGNGDSPDPVISKLKEILCAGSLEPACDLEFANKLADTHPAVFGRLTAAITDLTQQGSDIEKKASPSGPIPG